MQPAGGRGSRRAQLGGRALPVEGPDDGPPLAVDARRAYHVHPAAVHVHRPPHAPQPSARLPLDDAAQPVFLKLPRIDLEDGRPLRRVAFDIWAEHVRTRVRRGASFEARPRRGGWTEMTLLFTGGLIGAGGPVAVAVGWAMRPVREVTVNPTPSQGIAMAIVAAALAWLFLLSVLAMRRAWLCRHGSFVQVDARGIRVVQGQPPEPYSIVERATFDRWLRLTRIDFTDDRPTLHVPAEHGALARLDLVLAALHPPLRADLARTLG